MEELSASMEEVSATLTHVSDGVQNGLDVSKDMNHSLTFRSGYYE